MQLAKTDLMILPSIIAANGDQEGIPNVLKEAMAFGIPVISTREGAHELIEQRVSGFLVPEKDSQTLAYKIAYLIKNPDKCAQFGKNGRAFIEKEFDIKKIVRKLESIFLNLCRKKWKRK